MSLQRMFLTLLGAGTLATSLQAALIKPQEGVNYTPFFPNKWKAKGLESPYKMTAWEGKNVVLLTMQNNHSPKVMTPYINNIDKGWGVYQEMTGKQPRLYKHHNRKPTLAAIPSPAFSCGAGCGYVGVTGIELGLFYTQDLEYLKKDPNAVSHYVFYEMGRNFYSYKDKHSHFATGFAVFMRYVCVDNVKSTDLEPNTRKQIEALESHANDPENTLGFIDIFTTLGQKKRDTHKPRLKISRSHNSNYASAMLYLRKKYGGDAWVKRFYHTLDTADAFPIKNPNSGYQQSLNWVVCASIAAKRNLAPLFMERYRFPLSKKDQATLRKVNWRARDLKISPIVKQLSPTAPATKE